MQNSTVMIHWEYSNPANITDTIIDHRQVKQILSSLSTGILEHSTRPRFEFIQFRTRRSKIRKLQFFFQREKICPVRIFSQNSKSKTDYELKTDLQCLFRCSAGVQDRGKHLAQKISINIQ